MVWSWQLISTVRQSLSGKIVIIRLPWVEQVLNSPEMVESDNDDPELTHHVGQIKEHGNRALHVVFNMRVNPVRIVTVYFDRKMKGRL
jgi:hypothetical protein